MPTENCRFAIVPPQKIVTNTALPLISGLQVNIITTTTLFIIWKQSLDDMERARSRIDSLHVQAGGLFFGTTIGPQRTWLPCRRFSIWVVHPVLGSRSSLLPPCQAPDGCISKSTGSLREMGSTSKTSVRSGSSLGPAKASSLAQVTPGTAGSANNVVLSFPGSLVFTADHLKAGQGYFSFAYLYGHPAHCLQCVSFSRTRNRKRVAEGMVGQ